MINDCWTMVLFFAHTKVHCAIFQGQVETGEASNFEGRRNKPVGVINVEFVDVQRIGIWNIEFCSRTVGDSYLPNCWAISRRLIYEVPQVNIQTWFIHQLGNRTFSEDIKKQIHPPWLVIEFQENENIPGDIVIL